MAHEPNVSLSDKLKFENFYNEIVELTKSLNFDIFDKIYSTEEESVLFYCYNSKGANATAYFRDNSIFVQRNSKCRPALTDSGEQSTYIAPVRTALKNNGILKLDRGKLIFTHEYKFDTPSAASSVILGTPPNGWNDWKDKDGKSLSSLFRDNNPS